MAKDSATLWTVILAAGGSSRLRRPKQLLRIGGRLLITRTVDTAQRLTADRVVVVVGAERIRVRAAVRRCAGRSIVVTNPRWQEGMSGSLRRGLAAVPRRATAVLLLTVDQPLVGRRALARLIARWSQCPQRAAAACYGERLGVPAIVPRRFWALARRASGDVGAREILRHGRAPVTRVALAEAAVDIDTVEDLERFASAGHAC